VARELHVVSVPDQVYGTLRERILAGELEGGSRLHQEKLSEDLGVSRTPVREALTRLAAEGLVELLPNRGARVAAVTLADMRAAFEARLGLEPFAARLAAERRPAAAIKAMGAAIADQQRARTARTTYKAIRRFHLAIVEASGNSHLIRFAETLWSGRIGLHVYLRQLSPEMLAGDVEEHEEIAGAIGSGDAARAERVTRAHIAVSLDRLLAAVDEDETDAGLAGAPEWPRPGHGGGSPRAATRRTTS
jgi:DNA-binding GntR family transcriptional regulator